VQALTRLLIDESIVVEVTETSVDHFDGYALTLTTKDPSVMLVLVGAACELRQLFRRIDAAIGGLATIASDASAATHSGQQRPAGPSSPGEP
jgi:hypothetical protein